VDAGALAAGATGAGPAEAGATSAGATSAGARSAGATAPGATVAVGVDVRRSTTITAFTGSLGAGGAVTGGSGTTTLAVAVDVRCA